MTGRFDVDTDTLRDGARRMAELADRLTAEWQGFAADTLGRGDVFGDDPVGSLIGASYRSGHEIAERSLAGVAEALRQFGVGLTQMADTYDAAEQQNADLLRRITG